jgi:hypothetical protein
MVLEGIVEKVNIVYRSKQICANADDIVFVTRNTPILKEELKVLHIRDQLYTMEIKCGKTFTLKL